MASKSEIGHIKNVANFNVLFSTCVGFGANYNPSNSAITTTAQQAVYTAGDAAVNNSVNLGNTLQQVINTRVNTFVASKPTASRIIAALIACGADAETIKNAKTINRKIQGGRAKAIDAAAGTAPMVDPPTTSGNLPTVKQAPPINITPPVNISVSQQSYDRLVSNLRALINYVSQVPGYHPNETDLQVTALNTYWGTLQTANNLVVNAHVNYNSSLVTRTNVLYNALTGLVHIAMEVKQYVASLYGANSLQANEVKHIKFRTLK